MDCFAVSISFSVIKKEIKFFEALKIAIFFGIFQAIMPVLGWLLSLTFKEYIQEFDHWIAFGILGTIGVKMLVESLKKTNSNYKFLVDHQSFNSHKFRCPNHWRQLCFSES